MTTTHIPAPAPRTTTHADDARRASGRAALRPMAMDVAIPLAAYYLLRMVHVPLVTALALASIYPAVRTVTGIVRDRQLNGMAAIMLIVNLGGVAVSFATGDPRLMLAKETAVSSIVGLALLGAAALGRPLMSSIARPMLTRGQAARDAAFGVLSAASPRFRRLERWFTAAWGAVLLASCALQLAAVATLPVTTMAWLGTVMTFATVVVGIAATSPLSHALDTMLDTETGQ